MGESPRTEIKTEFDSADTWGVFNSLRYILPNKVSKKIIVCHYYQP